MLGHVADTPAGPGRDWLTVQLEAERTRRREHVATRLHPTKALAKLGTWWAVRQEWSRPGRRPSTA